MVDRVNYSDIENLQTSGESAAKLVNDLKRATNELIEADGDGVRPISTGGTGATTKEQALINLGAAPNVLATTINDGLMSIADKVKLNSLSGGTTASDIEYSNTVSGLSATDVQEAIDELAQSGGGFDPASDQDITGNWTFEQPLKVESIKKEDENYNSIVSFINAEYSGTVQIGIIEKQSEASASVYLGVDENGAGAIITADEIDLVSGDKGTVISSVGSSAQYGGTLSTPLGLVPVFRNISFTSESDDVDVNLIDTQGLFGYEILKDVFAADFSQLAEGDRIRVSLSKIHDWDSERVSYTDDLIAQNPDGDIGLIRQINLSIDGVAFADFSLQVSDDGTSKAVLSAKTIDIKADEVTGLESRVGTFPLAFDIERTYGSKATPLTGNLGWTKSSDDKRIYQEVYHSDLAAPTELASMTQVGDGVYMPSETNLIYIWCSLPNAANTEDGYFYTVTQV